MNLPALSSRESAPATAWAERLSRRLIREAFSWAQKLVGHSLQTDGAALESVFRETAAFAAFLLIGRAPEDTRLAVSKKFRDRLSTCLRRDYDRTCSSIRKAHAGRRPRAGDDGRLARDIACYSTGNQDDSWMTEKRYARFCEVTGMHSTALAGRGLNLAQIFFYLRIFALIDGDDRMTLEARKRLLRAAHDCREHFVELSERMLSDRRAAAPMSQEEHVGRHQDDALNWQSITFNRSTPCRTK